MPFVSVSDAVVVVAAATCARVADDSQASAVPVTRIAEDFLVGPDLIRSSSGSTEMTMIANW